MWRVLVVILTVVFGTQGYLLLKWPNISHVHKTSQYQDVGEPLDLTRCLHSGSGSENCQSLAKVTPDIMAGVPSYSGYFTVNERCGSSLFFWFFPAQTDWEEAPVMLWLQGGPGASSLFGLFDELGPVEFSGTVTKRIYSWNKKNNLLFVDQPVGTGFSFTRGGCYPEDELEVSNDLLSALVQFYELFPNIRQNDFYIAGESYGGHYVPSLAYTIHKRNPSDSADNTINLKGMMIGNGMMDMKYQYDYASYLYQLGLIDDSERDIYNWNQNELLKLIKREQWYQAHNFSDTFDLNSKKYISEYNYLKPHQDLDAREPWEEYIQTPGMRKSLHVGNKNFDKLSNEVYINLFNDFVQSVKLQVEDLLEDYPIVFYNGQLDVICAYPMMVNLLRNLEWSGAQDYLAAPRREWCVDGQLAGFVRSAHNLHEVFVRDAGHMVPQDQPHWAFQLMTSVTSSPPADPLRLLTSCR